MNRDELRQMLKDSLGELFALDVEALTLGFRTSLEECDLTPARLEELEEKLLMDEDIVLEYSKEPKEGDETLKDLLDALEDAVKMADAKEDPAPVKKKRAKKQKL